MQVRVPKPSLHSHGHLYLINEKVEKLMAYFVYTVEEGVAVGLFVSVVALPQE